MPKTIYALDNEFAASSGANINVSDQYSYFDHPPNSTADLTITSNYGDDHPFRFDLNETYDLTWSGHGGGIMEDATVIRSDYIGPGKGAVVFEGINSITGEPFQMVWSPGFDLEQWYWDNGGGPSSPNAFWTSDQNASQTVQVLCYAAGTRIAARQGEVLVEDLRLGDRVATADNGFQPIRFLQRKIQHLQGGDGTTKPIMIGAGALGDGYPRQNLVVSQNHRIVLGGQKKLAGMVMNEAFAPAKSLISMPKIRPVFGWKQVIWVHFAFEKHQVVFANGTLSESFYPGPVGVQALTPHERAVLDRVLPGGAAGVEGTARVCLSVGKVRRQLNARTRRDWLRVEAESRKWDDDLVVLQAEAARRAQRQNLIKTA
ncbi:MAG: Hint domain-containing protein [Pseudorhodobacter sp.]